MEEEGGAGRGAGSPENNKTPPQAPPQMQRSSGPTWRPAKAPAIACAATGSLSGGKRGLSRPGASIMWPLNRTTFRGPPGFGSAMNHAPFSNALSAWNDGKPAENDSL